MSKKTYRYGLAALAACVPAIAFAQTQTKTLSDLAQKVTGYFNQALVLMMGLAIVIFVWYVIRYYIRPNEERAQAGSYLIYSMVGFFVLLSIWGLVNVLIGTFGLQNTAPTTQTINGLFPGGGSSAAAPGGGFNQQSTFVPTTN